MLIPEQSWDERARTLSAHLDGGGVLDASLLALPLRHGVPADHRTLQRREDLLHEPAAPPDDV